MTIRLAILGTGGMAANHARAFAAIPGVQVVAGIDRRADVLAAFQAAHGIDRGFAALEAALDWGGFDAVANVTPDAVHFATTMACLAAGKHVLCEKPLATRAADAQAMADAAEQAGLVGMVNLSYRAVAALGMAATIVARGDIGTVRHLEASYLQSWLAQPAWGDWKTDPQWLWRLSQAHGSKGVLGDVGIHILDFATHAAGMGVAQVSCQLATFDKAPGGRIGDYRLDANDSATMQLRLTNGALATVTATRLAPGHLNDLTLRIYGDRGGLEVAFTRGVSSLRACTAPNLETALWRDIPCPPLPAVYDRFIAAIRGEGPADPGFARGAELQRLLDAAEISASSGLPQVLS